MPYRTHTATRPHRFKKVFAVLIAFALTTAGLTACGNGSVHKKHNSNAQSQAHTQASHTGG
jgi:hypothetical protein